MTVRAISLLSGGLDSALATKLVLEQGIEIIGVHFSSIFASRKEKERGSQAVRTAQELGIRLVIEEKGTDFLEMVKNPEHGYGKNMNPCIDCRIFMLKKIKGMMASEDAGFVITGEVLGQRPMSQMRRTINMIAKKSGLDDLILRPLSAKHFSPMLAEREGIVDRERLLGISGRSRNEQFRLAALYNLREFGDPGGGCLLTDPIFSVKLKELFENDPDLTLQDVRLLSIGRHFRINRTTKLIIGRDKSENEKLRGFHSSPYIFITPTGFKGPSGILKGIPDAHILTITANIMAHYGKCQDNTITIEFTDSENHIYTAMRIEMDFEKMRIQGEEAQ